MVMQQIDITAVYVGVIGYALFRLVYQCLASTTPRPAKKVVEEEVNHTEAEHVLKPKEATISVLPSLGSIQLAVIVVAGTLATAVPFPPQPLIAGGLLYILYCFHHHRISSTLSQWSTEEAAQHTTTSQHNSESHQQVCPSADAAADEKPRGKPQYSVLPSTACIQLAVLVIAGTRAREIGIPSQPLLASAIVYIYYRCILHWLAPLKAGNAAEKAVSKKEESKKEESSPSAEAASDPVAPTVLTHECPKVSHSVLPSVRSIQLAVLVAAGAAAVHLEMPSEPMLACAATYSYYRFVLHQFAPLKRSQKKQN